MSDVIIFLGPTFSKAEAADICQATYLSPAAQGDIYKAYVSYKPRIIGLIDGLFENVPAVWHKEILYCMTQGCHVIGASSMGALRAAELHSFGMDGVGNIFEAYKTGQIEDDDEVAVVHGPENFGYPQFTEAMVNIRVTLADALAQEAITDYEYDTLLKAAKNLHYKRRTYLNSFDSSALNSKQDRRKYFFEWLSVGRIDQKKQDAIALLKHISAIDMFKLKEKVVSYKFQNTQTWLAVTI